MAARILVVDDAQFMRMMLKNILSGAGYEIVGEGENGVQAIEKTTLCKKHLANFVVVGTFSLSGMLDAIEELLQIRERRSPPCRLLY